MIAQVVSVGLFVLVEANRAGRRPRPVLQPRADVGLHRVLARRATPLGALRRRLACPVPVARDRRRGRVGARARWASGAAARGLPGASRALARRRGAARRSPRSSCALLRSVEPTGAGVRDRALHLRRAVRDGAFGRDVRVRRGEGFAVAFAYFAGSRPLHVVNGAYPRALAVHGSGLRRTGARLDRGDRGDCSARSCSTATAGRPMAGPARERSKGRISISRPGIGELLVTGANVLGLIAAAWSSVSRSALRARSPACSSMPRATWRPSSCSHSSRSRSPTSSRTTSRSSSCRDSS